MLRVFTKKWLEEAYDRTRGVRRGTLVLASPGAVRSGGNRGLHTFVVKGDKLLINLMLSGDNPVLPRLLHRRRTDRHK